jgi:hypothetical protein
VDSLFERALHAPNTTVAMMASSGILFVAKACALSVTLFLLSLPRLLTCWWVQVLQRIPAPAAVPPPKESGRKRKADEKPAAAPAPVRSGEESVASSI